MTEKEKTVLISDRALGIKASITMSITAMANQLKKEGKPVIGMSAGEPDFDTPESIKQAGIQSIIDGKTKYTPASGIMDLKDAIVTKLKQENNLDYTVDNVIISCGGKHSLFNVKMALLNPGDEVIIPTPFWVSYPSQVEVLGGKCVYINAKESNDLKVTPEELEAAITPRTKLFILNTPSNPSGMVYSKEELMALAEVVVKHDIYVISDELYEKLIYDGHHVSIASLGADIKERSIIVNGVSKAYSMTGWRIGYAVADATLIKAMSNIQSHSTSNPAQASQWASLEAIRGSQDVVETMKHSFRERRKVLIDGLNRLSGIRCIEPKGAFYAFPNISSTFGKRCDSGLIHDAVSFCEFLLKEQLVATVPGSAFGAEGYIRLSYATSMDNINGALERLSLFLSSLK
ncbi:aspartate aminotransferase [bacterium]|nr:aspartate aminotransferase [bacterium]|tara:strand:- start:3536 stop:4747 length:1212 start_codon:yes stop_codon:yes gene_type:complete